MEVRIVFGHRNVVRYDGTTEESWWPYVCGHCGTEVAGAVMASVADGTNGLVAVRWLQCPSCKEGAVQCANQAVYPGAPFGPRVEGLPPDTAVAYDEARRCLAVSAYTAAELICRKILMHVAVDKGAEEGKSFGAYIDDLQGNGYVTPPMANWVLLIKDHGNLATHKLASPSRERSEGTMLFTAQLLRSVYEMAFFASKFVPVPEGDDDTDSASTAST